MCRTKRKAKLSDENKNIELPTNVSKAICAVIISESEGEAIHSISFKLAAIIGVGLDLIDNADEVNSLVGLDLLAN